MADPCETLVQSLSIAEAQQEQLLNQIATAYDANLSFLLEQQLKTIKASIVQLQALLTQCRKNSGSPPKLAIYPKINQSIQFFDLPYYDYPVVGQTPPNNNSVPMVAQKPTIIRLYVDIPDGSTISGVLNLNPPSGSMSIMPVIAPIVGRSLDSIDFRDMSQTLNFLIPLDQCVGTVQFTIDVQGAAASDNGSLAGSIAFVDVPPVKLYCLRMHYTGLNYNNQAVDATPAFLDVYSALNGMLAAYPIGEIDFVGCDTLEWNEQMKFDSSWSDLLDHLTKMRNQAGTNAIYLCFVPEAANCGGTCGKGYIGKGVCAFFAGPNTDPIGSICHEMGHAIGRLHAPECLSPGDSGDSNYPQYGPFLPRASIGGHGIDLRDLRLTALQTAPKDPTITRDYMSYCDPPWTSPYGWLYAMQKFRGGHFSDFAEKAASSKAIQYVHVDFDRVSRSAQILSGYVVEGSQASRTDQVAGQLTARILDKADSLLLEVRGTASDDDGDPLPKRVEFSFPAGGYAFDSGRPNI